MGYLKKEFWQFLFGMLYLFIGQVPDFTVPLYIGFVITAMEKGEFDSVGFLCLQLIIIVVVSGPTLNLGRRHFCRLEGFQL